MANKKFEFFLAVTAGLAFLIIATAVLVFLPYQGNRKGKTTINIRNGDGLNVIATTLQKNDLIRSKLFFKWFSVLMGKRRVYKRGEYVVDESVSVMDLINMLEKGTTCLLTITIPEGLRMQDIFSQLKGTGYNNTGNYDTISQSNEFIKSLNLPINSDSLEGFLFPETYKFSKEIDERTILRTMVKTFLKNIPNDYKEQAQKVGLTYYEAIILASIIEKETSVGNERNMIASVFHNRLKKHMKLQTDPTVIYGIPNFDGNLTRQQLRTRTPYNTYINYGLPPTPIANPGLASLMAAVKPANTSFLYFVAKGDGTHEFSTNYRDHRRAVFRFQKRRIKKYRSF